VPGLRRVVAGNPGPLTGPGTNSWILGEGEVAVIDPGPPDDAAHLSAILAALAPGERVSHILVTHAHLDHSGGAAALAAATDAPVLGHPPPPPLRSRSLGGGEGRDPSFRPDIRLAGGETLHGAGWRLRVLHTPGHFPGHLSFDWDGAVFSGDLIMGWATTLISPPDGDLAAFRTSVAMLRDLDARMFLPGHGETVTAPADRAQALLDHRAARETAILDALSGGPSTISSLVARLYTDTPKPLHAAAARNVLAHLLDLAARGQVVAVPRPGPRAIWSIGGHAASS
jgi:glyoxylase-like metal-dependent hydrolase (beta-lactamase superfamily II)